MNKDQLPQTREDPAAAQAELLSRMCGRVLVLTLNRPSRRNALTPTLYEALLGALATAAQDPLIGAIVLTGAGGAFSAGGDVSRMAAAGDSPQSPEERVLRLRQRTRIGELLHIMDKPTLAMMRGAAVGAGLSFALACDLRFAGTSAKFRTGFLPLALPGDHGGHYFLPRIVGPAKAREMYLLSPTLEAQEALRIGLVHQVLPEDELESAVMAIATRLADGPSVATAAVKRNLNDGLRLPLGELLDAEARRHVHCVDDADHREAAQAFVQKRNSQFKH